MKNFVMPGLLVTMYFLALCSHAQNAFPATGNVGIGTSAPSTLLHLVSVSPTGGIQGLNTQTKVTVDAASGGFEEFRSSTDNNTLSGLLFTDNNLGGYVTYRNYPDDKLHVGSYGGIAFEVGTDNNVGGKAERMRIDANGNVGIGTSTPASTTKLEINQTAGTAGQNQGLKIWAGNSFNYFGNSQVLFSYGGGGGAYSHAIKTRHRSDGISGNAFDFYLWQPGDPVGGEGSLNVMTLNGGNVGIGTSSPQAKLEVFNPGPLGTSSGSSLLLTRLSGSGNLNYFMDNTWLYRDASGSDWLTARLHNGISIDGSFLTPGVDTRTWWERAPFQDIQSFGTGSTTYLTIKGGNVGIGSLNPNQKLTVNGTIYGKEVKVDLSVPGPDYVFEKNYQLPTLEEIKAYIDQNKHLPEVPSAAEMERNGVRLGEMNMLLLKKVEELTLYVIEQNKELNSMKKEIQELKTKPN
jgi:hypothetical protein